MVRKLKIIKRLLNISYNRGYKKGLKKQESNIEQLQEDRAFLLWLALSDKYPNKEESVINLYEK